MVRIDETEKRQQKGGKGEKNKVILIQREQLLYNINLKSSFNKIIIQNRDTNLSCHNILIQADVKPENI